MSPDLPEKLLGIDIEDPSEQSGHDDDPIDEEDVARFVDLAIGEHHVAVAVDDVKTITDLPTLTRVPRSPNAIDGVADLRGEITAVIEPRVHFPVEQSPPEEQRLVVFDRPTDRQAAGIRVDDVLGVETVLVSDIVEDEADLEAGVDGTPLEHPLVSAIVCRRRGRSIEDLESIGAVETDTRDDARRELTGSGPVREDGEELMLEDFEDDDREDESVTVDEDADEIVGTSVLVDVETLLLASGQRA